MLKTNLFFILFLILSTSQEDVLIAQEFFLLDTTNTFCPINGADTMVDRRIISLNTCQISTASGQINDAGYPFNAPDITVTGNPVIASFELSRGSFDNFPDNIISYTSFVPIAGGNAMGVPFAPESLPMGIATDYNQNTYMVGLSGVSFIDDATLSSTYLGNLPPTYRPLGQMTFQEGSFYYPSVNHELVQLKIDENQEFYLRIVATLPDTLIYGGFFSIPHTCDSTTSYLIHREPDRGGTIYRIEIPGGELMELCEMPYKAMSAAYDGENILPICSDLELDLLTQVPTEINRYDTLCAGTISLLDNQLSLSPDLEYDSITAVIQNPLDGNQEWLSIGAMHPEVINAGDNTQRVTLASTGFTRALPLLEVLAEISYTNNATVPTQGQRIIEVTAWHPYYGSTNAYIYIEISDGTLNINTIASPPLCYGQATGNIVLEIEAGSVGYAINWEDGSTQTNRDNLIAGDYNYQITDEAGCSYADTILLSQPDTLIVSVAAENDTICGSTGILTATVQGGTPDYEYNWSSGGEGQSENILPSGTYFLTTTDVNGCLATAEYTLAQADTLFASLEEQSCLGEAVMIAGASFSQDTSFQLLLTTVDGCDSLLTVDLLFFDTFYTSTAYEFCPGESINLYDLSITQDTSFLVTLQTVNGCDSLEYYDINFLETPITTLDAEICEGEDYGFANNILSVSGLYYDTLTASSGCDSLLELNLVVQPIPDVVIEQVGSFCNDTEVLLSVDEGFTSSDWSTGSTASNLTVVEPGEYSVSVIDDNGCSNVATISLTETSPDVAFLIQNPDCPEGTGQIELTSISGGIAPYILQQTGEIVQAGDIIDGLPEGNYNYILEDALGCTTALGFQILATTSLNVNLPEDVSIKLGESVALPVTTSFQPSVIIWSPSTGLSCTDCLNPNATPTETTRYALFLSDDNNCSFSGDVLVTVGLPEIYIPNAFSPNGDGSNDVFAPVLNAGVATITSFSLYDRWGSQVFSMTNEMKSWDGFYRGEPAQQGVYVFSIEWVDLAGNRRNEMGEVLLLR